MAPGGDAGSVRASGLARVSLRLPTSVTTVHVTDSEALAEAAESLGAAHLFFLTTALSMQGATMGYDLTRDGMRIPGENPS